MAMLIAGVALSVLLSLTGSILYDAVSWFLTMLPYSTSSVNLPSNYHSSLIRNLSVDWTFLLLVGSFLCQE